jgi:hypothetical protein
LKLLPVLQNTTVDQNKLERLTLSSIFKLV